MGPGFDFFDNIHPALYFSSILLPALLCIPIWGAKSGGIMISIAVPTFFLVAHWVCTIEERRFVEAHKANGIGPTPRHFDPQSWLSYDPLTGKLSGAD
jgi:hypothetical protein